MDEAVDDHKRDQHDALRQSAKPEGFSTDEPGNEKYGDNADHQGADSVKAGPQQ
jgi:hypothetical protein